MNKKVYSFDNMAQCSSKAKVPCNSEQKVLVSERAIEMFLLFGIPFCRMQHEPAIHRKTNTRIFY